MNSVVVRTLFSLFVPGGLIFFATAALLQLGLLHKSLSALVHIYPFAVAGAGVLLGWRFNRSRMVFAILVLALADRALVSFPISSAKSLDVGQSVYNAVAFLLPLNLAALSFMKERGILTWRGLVRLSLIFIQILAVYLICRFPQPGIAAALNYSLNDGSVLSRLPFALPALFAFGAAFLLLTFRFIQSEGVMENGFFWALLSSFFAVAMVEKRYLCTIYFATAGLVLIISVIETSHSMAFSDQLTGLPGRRALEEALLKLGNNYSVAMLDIDRFKRFNDRYGHDAGDQVLRMVATKLAKVTGGGKSFRYGGEEFTIIFPGKCVAEATPHLERLRKVVEQTRFIVRGHKRPLRKPEDPKKIKGSRKKVKITISIGLAEKNERFGSPHEVITAADKALYRAKKAGRNRIKT
ncbi:MAG: GGDEF domain-containing protein [Syntrophobacterales bacterium]